MIEHILVPIDFSETTDKIIAVAVEQAVAFNATIHLVHVQVPFVNTALHNMEPALAYKDASPEKKKYDQEHLDETAEKFTSRGISTETTLVDGNPSEEILSYCEANNINEIIIGSHGHGALHHIILGSVSEKVLHKSSCPVMVVRS
jgi:nucleotide-binding universal stress UspA family protein